MSMEDICEWLGKALLTVGNALAAVISYQAGNSLIWATAHGMAGWLSIIYTLVA